MWFFSTAAAVLKRPDLRVYADHAYRFLDRFGDPENGGLFWSVTYDGKPADTTKHTYCQAFAVYGLAAYYRLTGNPGALDRARSLFRVIETKCRDAGGYLEAQTAAFTPESNEKLSENGVLASRTMNTLLHVIEAYAELYRARPDEQVRLAGKAGLRQCLNQVMNPVKRRLEVHVNTPTLSYIDDYAHHPSELTSAITSMRDIFPGRKLTGIFQPHLYTRTRDFAAEFAKALSAVDKLILLDIYPAREEPIPGVTSEMIFKDVTAPEKVLLKKEELMDYLSEEPLDVLATFGAGNIDRFIEPITKLLNERLKSLPRGEGFKTKGLSPLLTSETRTSSVSLGSGEGSGGGNV